MARAWCSRPGTSRPVSSTAWPRRRSCPIPAAVSGDGGELTADAVPLDLHAQAAGSDTVMVAADLAIDPDALPGTSTVRFEVHAAPNGTADLTIT
ncbi:hypothetical protein [Streptomyces aureoversilis]|uniref:Uncharacterized protein n=1 Tax=Streptomyces aureoversilis TaxID=67277 RepID=A0ABV9ZTT4_9ACTN